MKKITTNVTVLVASVLITAGAMAQTDTTKPPVPDSIPGKPDSTKPDSIMVTTHRLDANKIMQQQLSQLHKYHAAFYAITNRELLNGKLETIKEETEA